MWSRRCSFFIFVNSFLSPLVSNWIAWNTHFWTIMLGNTAFTPDSSRVEKSMVMKFTGLGSHFFSSSNKKVVSSSLSPETKAPAIGLFSKESVAINNPCFNVPNLGRFFLLSRIWMFHPRRENLKNLRVGLLRSNRWEGTLFSRARLSTSEQWSLILLLNGAR